MCVSALQQLLIDEVVAKHLTAVESNRGLFENFSETYLNFRMRLAYIYYLLDNNNKKNYFETRNE